MSPIDVHWWKNWQGGQPDHPTYQSLRDAWEKMKEPPPERPMVFSPDELALLQEHGMLTDGRLDVPAVLAWIRENSR